MIEDLIGDAFLDKLAAVYQRNAIANVANDAEVVGNEQVG
jgi:hypothetical protein